MGTLLFYTHDPDVAGRWTAAFGDSRAVEAATGGQLLAPLLEEFDGGVVLVDLASPGANPELLHRICRDYPGYRFVAAYMRFDPQVAVALLEAGLRGYCNRYSRDEILREVVRVVEAGEVWVGERLMSQLLAAFTAASPDLDAESPDLGMLTDREREVLPRVLDGLANKVIARELDITERTVKAHVSSILHKLDVTDRMQLALRFRKPHTTD